MATWCKQASLNPLHWCGIGKGKVEETVRIVNVNFGSPNPNYQSNYTSTTKYSIITFLPKALFEQYRRFANIYFTVGSALSLTRFSPVRPWTTWTPLVIVIGVSIIKEGIEDYKRYKADKEINNRLVEVLIPDRNYFVIKKWKELKPGEIIVTKKDEIFACDVLFLAADSEEGTCHIETMNLDGETNLKIKKALDETKDLDEDGLRNFRGIIECEPPNSRLYQFTGNLLMESPGSKEQRKVPVGPGSVLLRGCSLRNTPRVFGAVIYAGHQSKIFKNSTAVPSKRSQIERQTDKVMIFMFSILFLMLVTVMGYVGTWTKNKLPDQWYLAPWEAKDHYLPQYDPSKPATAAWTHFVTAFILYNYLIPIALYVTMEVVKVVQSMVFVSNDREMYHSETDTPALARTSNLNEELGMVDTVLSDKTGTLTRNVMEFFKCSIGGISYGAGVTEVERSNADRKGEVLALGDDSATSKYREPFFNFYDARLMDGNWINQPDATRIEMFFRMLSVCHTIIPEGPPVENLIKYEAESPDEAALVVAAKVLGFFFYKRTNTKVGVKERTADGVRDVQYEVLNILEFNSTRKRMSIIVRDDSGKIMLFTKGADTVIYERLDQSDEQNERLKVVTSQHMEEYGSAGLRTLCVAYADLDPDFYQTWQLKFMEAKTSLQDRDAKLADVSEEMEKNLRLLGCTAIEDKLQDGVPQCIKQLAAAGIRLWVLTGDKMETAINISYACSLITDDMQQFTVSAYFPEAEALEAEGRMEEADQLANRRMEQQLLEVQATMRSNSNAEETQYAMIIDGKALSYALSDRLSGLFLEVGIKCLAVVCCRVSPLQKAQVTSLVAKHGDVTLAIGDGANDVGMIQAAHIGVGISGQEGMQAVMSSDFAIAQFRYLRTLLLVHGRYSYKRIARMINFFIYKNMMYGTTIYAFDAITGFSGQYPYNDFYMTLFNVLFTSFMPFAIGIFDKDVDKEMCYKYPALYKQGQRNQYFGWIPTLGWILQAMYQCMMIMVFFIVGCGSKVASRGTGQPWSMFEMGVAMFSVSLIAIHLEAIQITEQWTWAHHVSVWFSTGIWWVYVIAYGAFPIDIAKDLYYMFTGVVAGNPQYWWYLLVTPIACTLPGFLWRNARRQLYPEEHHLVQELQKNIASGRHTDMPVEGHEAGQQSLAYKMFEYKSSNKNAGFVPPYDRNSRFFTFNQPCRPRTGAQPPPGPPPVTASEPQRLKSAALKAHPGLPIWSQVDKELTNNPMRKGRRGLTLRAATPAESRPAGHPPSSTSHPGAVSHELSPEDIARRAEVSQVLKSNLESLDETSKA